MKAFKILFTDYDGKTSSGGVFATKGDASRYLEDVPLKDAKIVETFANAAATWRDGK